MKRASVDTDWSEWTSAETIAPEQYCFENSEARLRAGETEATYWFATECQLLAGACIPPTDALRVAHAAWTALRLCPAVHTLRPAHEVAKVLVAVAQHTLNAEVWQPCTTQPEVGGLRMQRRAMETLNFLFRHHRSAGLSLDLVAQEMHLTRSHVCQLLKMTCGYGFHTHVSGFRILSAMTLLAATRNGIKEVASNCGYRYRSEMDRDFRRWIHMSPTRFRRLIAE